ncbi:ATP-grasp domain-containing protein [Companilactobacillus ginsenosidimutans]|uniref:carbamoyl-phosphate synthase (ammonia) n=1 Tax=Companilactobacillus ginsenosidimutans TaxID=1007676 RepID=A0A0H4QIR2_9LACO|nr:ATP-grasp domain-containing protein [Companilactobacillus ginsenosidimutans]AKP66573.1 carbamoyl phosphate synthase large subunit [Companilactobacillus ginsenosidimutans]
MVTSGIHNILIIGPTNSDKNVDLSTALYDTAEILHQLGYKTTIMVENPTALLSSSEFFDKVVVEKVNGENILDYVDNFHPDAILPTVGDKNALGIISGLNGKISSTNVLGTDYFASLATFKREMFISKLNENDLPVINFISSDDEKELYDFIRSIGFPIIARRRFSNRHSSGWTNINNLFELDNFMALEDSQSAKIEIERSIRGFSEYSFTVVRDRFDNSALIGTIEDVEPIGIHHLDSNLVSPAISLNDSKLQKLRNFAMKLARVFDVVGACTVHFAYNHKTNECYITEFIPRLSEETKFLEYATSYPLATVSVELNLGYQLDKLQLDSGSSFNGASEPFMDHITSRFPQWNTTDQRYIGPSKTSDSSIIVSGFSIEEVFNKGALNDKLNDTLNRYEKLHQMDDDQLFEKIIHPTNWMLDVLIEAIRRDFELSVLSEVTGINIPYLVALKNIKENSAIIRDDEIDENNIENVVGMGVKGIGYSKVLLDRDDVVTRTVVKSKKSVSVNMDKLQQQNYFLTSGISNDLEFTDRNKIIVRSPIITSKKNIMVRQFVLMQLVKSINQNGLEAVILGREPWNSPLEIRNVAVEIADPHMELQHLNLIQEKTIFKIIDFSQTLSDEDTENNRVFQISTQPIKSVDLKADTTMRIIVVSDGTSFSIPSVIFRKMVGERSYEISAFNNFLTDTDKSEITNIVKNELEDSHQINTYNFEFAYSHDHWMVTKITSGMNQDIIRHELASSVHVIDTLVKLILGNNFQADMTVDQIFKNDDEDFLVTTNDQKFNSYDAKGIQKIISDKFK